MSTLNPANVAIARPGKIYSDTDQKYIDSVVERTNAWLKAVPGRSQKTLECGTKWSRATISLFLCGRYYNGDALSVAKSISAFLDREEEQIEVGFSLEPVEFPSWKTVTTALYQGKLERGFDIIYGDPGVGKTFPAQHFAAQDPDYNVLIMATAGLTSLQGFMAILLARLTKTKQIRYGYLERMADEIINLLIKSPKYIITNEGQRCQFPIFDFACDLQEQAGIGLAFVGHDTMYDNITRMRRIDSQTFDRVDNRATYTHVERGKIQPDLMLELARQILPDITDEGLSYLCDDIAFPQLRHVIKACRRAKTLLATSRRGRASDRSLLEDAVAMITGRKKVKK